VAAVYQETAGNPFFITEIVRLLVSERRLASLQEALPGVSSYHTASARSSAAV
jgi:predicted ATPase